MPGLGTAALATGAAAGAFAALTFWAMIALLQCLWGWAEARWMILPICVLGGALIGWTRMKAADAGMEEQLGAAREPEGIRRREALYVALGAVVAVGFGAAVGPEAGHLAVTAQLSTLVATRLGRGHAERALVAQAGAAGALAGF